MTEDDDTEARWRLSDLDRELLDRLIQALWGLAPLARRGNDLVALGEAWDAIEQILNGEPVTVNVGLSVGFRRGDKDFEEGLFVCFRVNEYEIVLDELHTSYASNVGSDHFTRDFALLRPRGSFDDEGIGQWLASLEEVQACDDARLTSERDHI